MCVSDSVQLILCSVAGTVRSVETEAETWQCFSAGGKVQKDKV